MKRNQCRATYASVIPQDTMVQSKAAILKLTREEVRSRVPSDHSPYNPRYTRVGCGVPWERLPRGD